MKIFIKKLNSGSAPGIDGVTAGHVKSATFVFAALIMF